MIIAAFVAVSAVLVVAIALGTVGSVSAGLAQRPRRAVYDVEDAVVFIGDRLPSSVSGTVSYDDVRAVVDSRIRTIADVGMASDRVDDSGVSELVLVSDDEVLARTLAELEDRGIVVADEHVAAIFVADDEYQRAIGMVRPGD